jgi:hypothetical protein
MLLDLGLPRENLNISDICTFESDQYPSHYKFEHLGTQNGRFIVAAWMNG